MDTEKKTKSDETIEDSKADETSTPTTDERLALIEKELKEAKSLAEVDYVAVVDPETLRKIKRIGKEVLVAVAVKIGEIRLIDNLKIA